MEDQPTDSGDLTTDAPAADETSTPRRRHRLPLQKERRALKEEPDAAQVDLDSDGATADEPPSPVELTSSTAEEPAAEQPKRRRWNFLRRRKNRPQQAATEQAATEQVAVEGAADDTPTTADAATAPRTPVGKAGRSAKQDSEPETTSDDEPVAEPSDSETGGETTESTESAGEEPILVPHQPAGKWLRIAAVAAACLFVAGGAFVGAMVQPVLADRASVDTKLDIARTAQSAITTLWSYTPDNMDSLADRSAGYLTGDFASEYRKFIDSIVATNKQAQVTNTTSVLGTAVESVTPSAATAIVYTNSVATSPVSKNIPSLRYLSYRLEMKRDDGKWRVTRMTTVTTLDLTPQL